MRDTSVLGQHEFDVSQHPIVLVYFAITGDWGPVMGNNSDVDLYLNRTTNELSLFPATGYDLFPPLAGLSVPSIEQSDQATLSDVSITVSNVDQKWYAIMTDSPDDPGDPPIFRDARVDVWFGNIVQTGPSPDAIALTGAITMYTGRIDSIVATDETATIEVLAHASPWQMFLPHQSYSPDKDGRFGGFRKIPPAGTKIRGGSTDREL